MIGRKLRKIIGTQIRSLILAKHRLMGVKIGKGCFISMSAWIDNTKGKIIIEDEVIITKGAKILSHDAAKPLLQKKTLLEGSGTITHIEHHCFIGMNAIVLSGVHVGEHSIVGAGCVVSKNVPAFSVVIGNPMQIVKQFNKETGTWNKVD
jgi:acetyltransferase-like isoleucine patch superfamily enzyme